LDTNPQLILKKIPLGRAWPGHPRLDAGANRARKGVDGRAKPGQGLYLIESVYLLAAILANRAAGGLVRDAGD
jgi:hypothetical protein